MINNVLNDNVRLSADPESYALVARQRVEKYDEIMVLPEKFYV